MSVSPDVSSNHIQIHLLGGFRATRNGSPVSELDSGRTSILLAYLLLHRGAPVSRRQLAYTFWPDTSDKQSRANLRTILSRLRSALNDADDFLFTTHQTVQLRADAPLNADLFDFVHALDEAGQSDDEDERTRHLEQAIAAYRGDLLPDCYDDWISPQRERLRGDYLRALETLILLHEARRNYDAAIRHAQRLLRTDPLHEATYRRLMRLHALNGDRAGALRVYHVGVDHLRRELGVEPGARTQEAYRRLLNRETTEKSELGVSRGRAPLVGRDREWRRLVEAWRRAGMGQPGIVAITGDAGIGKTRLAEEMVAWAERQGITVAVAHCYASGSYITGSELAYGPIAQWLQTEQIRDFWSDIDDVWLSELARIIPGLLITHPTVSAPKAPSDRWQRQHLFEALARALLAGDRPLLLLIDDLQWCDGETLDWLHYLLQFDIQHPLLILATVRQADVADEHRYRPFRLALQRRDRLDEIHLMPLTVDDTAVLANDLSSEALTPEQAAVLFQDTEGNPLFVVETLQMGGEIAQMDLTGPTAGHSISSLPPKVTAVLQQRLAQLTSSTQQLVQLAAVIGRDFTFDTLAQICEQTEDEVVDALDEAWRRRIIREQGADAYDFSHDKLRAVAYAQVSPVRRRYLHRRVGSFLAAKQIDRTDDDCTQIAHHFLEAGDLAQAAFHYHRAVDVASRRYAIESLLSSSTNALILLQQLDPDKVDPANLVAQAALIDERMWSWEMVGDMDSYLGDLATLKTIGAALGDEALLNRESRLHAAALIRLGRYREAEEMALANAARHSVAGSAQEEGICLTIVGRARRELGEHARAVEAFEQALTLLDRANAFVYQIQAYSYLSTTFWQMEDFEQALLCGQQALAICEREAMPERKRFALGDMGAAAAMLGQEEQARHWLTESLSLARQVTDSTQEAFCLGHLGRLALRGGDLETAERELQAAYDLSKTADLINYASWLLRGLSETATEQGQAEKAHTLASEALSIARSNHQQMEAQAARRLLKQS